MIPTTEDLNNATKLKIPHYSYQFKPYKELTNGKLDDTVLNEPSYTPGKHDFDTSTSLAKRIAALKQKFPGKIDGITTTKQNEPHSNSDSTDPLQMMPHPYSDCRHVDPPHDNPTFLASFRHMMSEFSSVEKIAGEDGELNDKFRQARAALVDAERMLRGGGGAPQGMQRLRMVFEWTLGQVIAVFGEINRALEEKDEKKYEEARQVYIELLRDLDDHEPHIGPKPPKSGESGYGRVIKWSFIAPLIFDGKIMGATVVAKWNPHISSSGIPIPHS